MRMTLSYIFIILLFASCGHGCEQQQNKENEEERLRRENEIKLKLKEEISQKVIICTSCCIVHCLGDIDRPRECNFDSFNIKQSDIFSQKPVIRDNMNFAKNILTFALFERKLKNLIAQETKDYIKIFSLYNSRIIAMTQAGDDINSYYRHNRAMSGGSLTISGDPIKDKRVERERARQEEYDKKLIDNSANITAKCEKRCKSDFDPDN